MTLNFNYFYKTKHRVFGFMVECKNHLSCMYLYHVRETSSNFMKKKHGLSIVPFFDSLDIDMMLRNAYESISFAIEVKSKNNHFTGGSWIFFLFWMAVGENRTFDKYGVNICSVQFLPK